MPELPEVEIAARRLREWVGGERVTRVAVAPTRIVRGASAEEVRDLVEGRRVTGVERRGKWLRFGIEGGGALFSHLGMTGKWVQRSKNDAALQHERARLDTARTSVRYHDQRLFGRLVPAPDGAPIPEWSALGRDPLDDGLDAAWLHAALAQRRTPVKLALLDQSLIAGLGNIQVTEALWRARIHPERRASELDRAAVKRLVDGILGSLRDTITKEDGPEITYVEEPGAPNPFGVYGRAGAPCPRCHTLLQRSTLGGRGTVWCPTCQKSE
jgi:formamidopyrimidine-DNA glycosylase